MPTLERVLVQCKYFSVIEKIYPCNLQAYLVFEDLVNLASTLVNGFNRNIGGGGLRISVMGTGMDGNPRTDTINLGPPENSNADVMRTKFPKIVEGFANCAKILRPYALEFSKAFDIELPTKIEMKKLSKEFSLV